MMRRVLVHLAVPAAFLLVAGCDPRPIGGSGLSPRDLQALAGTWEGQSSQTYGDDQCPQFYLWTLRVAQGNVEGSLVNRETPKAPRTPLTTFLDYDGTMVALARPGGRDTSIRGTFTRDAFRGEAKAKECNHSIRLRRVAGS